MQYQAFEQRVLELFFKTGDRITAPLVAFKVGLPVEEARAHLEAMASKDIVSMEVDDAGVIYFDMPGRPPPTGGPLSWQAAPVPPAAYPVMLPMVRPVPMVPMVYPEPEKSVVGAAMLATFFGPLGMLYATTSGAAVMFVAGFLFTLLTLGLGAPLVWLGCIVWATVAASNHNERVREQRMFLSLQAQSQAPPLHGFRLLPPPR